jgi:hypothetical protein
MSRVGADPEVFISMQGVYAGQPYSGIIPAAIAFDILKESDFKVNATHKKYPAIKLSAGKLIVDGISLELNPVEGSVARLVSNTRELMQHVARMLENMRYNTSDSNFEMYIRPVSPLDLKMLDIWNDPMLSMFGCDPDATIYGERDINPSNIDAKTHPWRYFGGHVHIEWLVSNVKKYFADPENLYRAAFTCDCTLGPASILLDQVVSRESKRRRGVYGQPSAHRPQKWGLEYRYPTNSWLLSPERMKAFFSIAEQIPNIMDVISTELEDEEDLVRAVLVSGDVEGAEKLLNRAATIVANSKLSNTVANLIDISRYNVRGWRHEWH